MSQKSIRTMLRFSNNLICICLFFVIYHVIDHYWNLRQQFQLQIVTNNDQQDKSKACIGAKPKAHITCMAVINSAMEISAMDISPKCYQHLIRALMPIVDLAIISTIITLYQVVSCSWSQDLTRPVINLC